jgi:hypothetical protein
VIPVRELAGIDFVLPTVGQGVRARSTRRWSKPGLARRTSIALTASS